MTDARTQKTITRISRLAHKNVYGKLVKVSKEFMKKCRDQEVKVVLEMKKCLRPLFTYKRLMTIKQLLCPLKPTLYMV